MRRRDPNKPRRTPAKKDFTRMNIGDVLTFTQTGIKQKGLIVDFDDSLYPIIKHYGFKRTIIPSQFIKFERRGLD